MKKKDIYKAHLATRSALPALTCGHCGSMLSKSRIFVNEGTEKVDIPSNVIAYCSADDCGAVNCCDEALKALDDSEVYLAIAS